MGNELCVLRTPHLRMLGASSQPSLIPFLWSEQSISEHAATLCSSHALGEGVPELFQGVQGQCLRHRHCCSRWADGGGLIETILLSKALSQIFPIYSRGEGDY